MSNRWLKISAIHVTSQVIALVCLDAAGFNKWQRWMILLAMIVFAFGREVAAQFGETK